MRIDLLPPTPYRAALTPGAAAAPNTSRPSAATAIERGRTPESLPEALLGLRVQIYTARAQQAVVQVRDGMLGTLVDLRA